jgi:hypothetical protein
MRAAPTLGRCLEPRSVQERPGSSAICRERSSGLLLAASDIGNAQSWLETAALVEAVHARILPAALQHDVIATCRPGLRKRGLDHRPTMPSSSELRMSDDVLEECMPMPAPQEVRRGNQHACGDDLALAFRHEYGHTVLIQRLTPDRMSLLDRLNGRAHFRRSEEIEQRFQICRPRCPCSWHASPAWVDLRPPVLSVHVSLGSISQLGHELP